MAPVQSLPAVTPIEERGYAHPEVLVSTEWVAEHLKDPKVRLIESNEDLLLYDTGHIPGAVKVDWTNDLNDPLIRDYIDRDRLQNLLRSKGVDNDTTIVFYGDKNNWWATYAFWVLKLFGVERLRLMDGGRLRWVDEGRPLSTEVPSYRAGNITVGRRNDAPVRAFREEVLRHVSGRGQLVDVRSPEEFGASACTCRSTPAKVRCAAATFRAPKAFPGPAPSTRRPTLSVQGPSFRTCMRRKTVSTGMRKRSPTAESANAPPIPGLRSPTCSASMPSGTTTDRGPSGVTA